MDPHLQYCLIVWGDFEGSRNATVGRTLLRHQKKFAGMINGQGRSFHSDPAFLDSGILKISDLYRQQLRIHAWQFWNSRLPECQSAMFQKTSEVHRYATRTAGTGMALSSRDHCSIAFRAPREWASLPGKLREVKSLSGFKRKSKEQLFEQYKRYTCVQEGCFVCQRNERERTSSQSGQETVEA